jgi:hypothetical protein
LLIVCPADCVVIGEVKASGAAAFQPANTACTAQTYGLPLYVQQQVHAASLQQQQQAMQAHTNTAGAAVSCAAHHLQQQQLQQQYSCPQQLQQQYSCHQQVPMQQSSVPVMHHGQAATHHVPYAVQPPLPQQQQQQQTRYDGCHPHHQPQQGAYQPHACNVQQQRQQLLSAPYSVSWLLQRLEMERYLPVFQQHEIDSLLTLCALTKEDMVKLLGLPLGAAVKICKAINYVTRPSSSKPEFI